MFKSVSFHSNVTISTLLSHPWCEQLINVSENTEINSISIPENTDIFCLRIWIWDILFWQFFRHICISIAARYKIKYIFLKWKHVIKKISTARGLKDSYRLSKKQKRNVSSHQSPCSFHIYWDVGKNIQEKYSLMTTFT